MSDRNSEAQKNEAYLEGYKNLSTWNIQDAQAVISFDKIFLPVTITGLAASLGKYPQIYPYAYIGSWLLLTFWVLLSWRYRARIEDRFHVMHTIECRLDFDAHRELRSIAIPPRDRDLRGGFYLVAVLLAAGAWRTHTSVPRTYFYLSIILPALSIVLWVVVLIACWCRKRRKKKQDCCDDSPHTHGAGTTATQRFNH